MPKSETQKQRDEYNRIEKSLIKALCEKGKPAPFMMDKISEYMMYWEIRKQLQKAVGKSKAIIKYNNGGGQSGQKVNDALKELPRISKTMENILVNLDLNGVVIDETAKRL